MITIKNSEYYLNNKKITDEFTLLRIKKLRIPPIWKDIYISPNYDDYLQASGIDSTGKKQYIYHPLFVSLTEHDKYKKLKKFNKNFYLLTRKINNISKNDLKNYMMALMFKIMFKTYSRIGNECYAENNSTYGITTLEKQHITIIGDKITFKFNGKCSIFHNIVISDKSIANDLYEFTKNLKKNDRIFTVNGSSIRANDMNIFLKESMGDDLSCKDFRTYISNKLFIETIKNEYKNHQNTHEQSILKKIIRNTYKIVAEKLGHSDTISRNSYVTPILALKFLENPDYFKDKNAYDIINSL